MSKADRKTKADRQPADNRQRVDDPENSLQITDLNRSNDELRLLVQSLKEKNEYLKSTLARAKEEIAAIKEEVAKLKAPPLPYGTFIRISENPEMVVIAIDGRMMEVNVANLEIDPSILKPGQKLLLNPSYNVLELREPEQTGEIGKIVDLLEGLARKVVNRRGGQKLNA